MGFPLDLVFRTKGQLAIDICTDALADGIRFDFFCGDEVYGNCTELRSFLEGRGQAYVLRVPSNFHLTLAKEVRMTCAQAVSGPLTGPRRWETRSAGKGSKGERWYGWAWLGTASPRHCLLIRRHLSTGELAFHYCYVPEGQAVTKARLTRAAGLRWPVEEDFELGKDCFGLDESQGRLYTAIARHVVLVMAALAICAVTAALLRDRTSTQAPPPVRPGQPPPPDPGMIPLTVPEIRRLLARPPHHAEPTRPRRALAGLATPPPGQRALVPPAHTPRPRYRDSPGQLAIGCCRTSRQPTRHALVIHDDLRDRVRIPQLLSAATVPTWLRA